MFDEYEGIEAQLLFCALTAMLNSVSETISETIHTNYIVKMQINEEKYLSFFDKLVLMHSKRKYQEDIGTSVFEESEPIRVVDLTHIDTLPNSHSNSRIARWVANK